MRKYTRKYKYTYIQERNLHINLFQPKLLRFLKYFVWDAMAYELQFILFLQASHNSRKYSKTVGSCAEMQSKYNMQICKIFFVVMSCRQGHLSASLYIRNRLHAFYYSTWDFTIFFLHIFWQEYYVFFNVVGTIVKLNLNFWGNLTGEHSHHGFVTLFCFPTIAKCKIFFNNKNKPWINWIERCVNFN